MANVNLTSKFVDVGSTGGPGGSAYGYKALSGQTFIGTLSETANGSSDTTTANLYSTTTTIQGSWHRIVTGNASQTGIVLVLDGNRANSGWTSLLVGTTSFLRSNATYTYDSGNNRTEWFWQTSTNYYGTVNGADVVTDIRIDLNTGHTSTVSPTSLSANETTTTVYALSNASSTKYRIIKETGQTPSVADGGTVNSRTGSGNINIPTSGQPVAGVTATYQLQIGGPNSQTSDNDAWIDTTGQNNSFSITRTGINYGGAPPTERDHGNNPYISMNGGTIAYATSQGTTVITTRNPSTGSESTVLTTGANPTRGTFSATTGNIYFADKPIHFNSSGFGHRMVPLTAKGKEFGDYHTRYGNQTYYFYAEQDTNVAIYDNVTGGIEGTSTSSFLLSASSVQSYTRSASNSATWIFFASDADMVMSKTGGSGSGSGDKHVLAPAADYIYYRRGQYVRAVDNTGVTNSTGGSQTPGVSYDTAGDRVVAVAIGDGAGGDSEQGQGDHNISNSYLWPWSLRDFVLVAPNTNKIHVESFSSGQWTLQATYSVSGTTTSPATIRRDGDSGFTTNGSNWTGNAAQFNSNTLWRFRGTNNFAVFVNDNSTDEEAIWGYTATVVDVPTDITFGADPGTEDELVSITATGSGGQGGVVQVSEDNTNWDSNVTSYTFTRGTPKTIYSRRFLSSENLISASTYSEALTADYLDPSNHVANTANTNAYLKTGDTSFTWNVFLTPADSGTVTQIRTGSYTGSIVGSRSGAGAVTVSDAPAANSSKTYYVTKYKSTETGGAGPGTVTNVDTFVAYRAGDAANTVTLAKKWVDVQSSSGTGGLIYGYEDPGTGTISNTADGASNKDISGIFAASGTTEVLQVLHRDYISDVTSLELSKSTGVTNLASRWTKLTIDGYDFQRANASAFTTGSPATGFHQWNTNTASNPFGETLNANKLVEFKLEVERGANLSATNTSLSSNEVANTVVTLAAAASDQKYRLVKVSGTNAGGSSNGTIVSNRVGNGTMTLGSTLQPNAGGSVTYELQTSGEFADQNENYSTGYKWIDTNGSNQSFTITRSVEDDRAPTISDVTNDNDASASVQVTVSLSDNGNGGDGLFYGRASTNNSDNVTSWQTGNTFQQNRGTDFYYFASRSSDTGANNGLASAGVLESVGYLPPDSSISAQNVTFSGSSNATTSVTVLGTTAGETIEVRINSVPYTISYGSAVATGTSTVVPVTSGLPTQGNTTTYRLSATRPTSTGGDGLFDISSDTVSITREADSGPTFTVTYSDTETQFVNISFNFSDEGSGGNGNLYYVADATLGIFPPPFGWSTTPPSSQTRGTTIKYWVSRTSNGSSLNGTFTLNVPVLAADRDVGSSPASQNVIDTASSATITLHDTSANNLYRVVAFDEQGGVLSESSKSATATTETFTVPLSGLEEGDTLSYTIFGSRPINRGGDGFSLAVNSASTIEVVVDNGTKPSPPFSFSIEDVADAPTNAYQFTRQNEMAIYTGAFSATIKQESACSGIAEFATNCSKVIPPASSFSSIQTVEPGELVHVRMLSSSQAFTTVEAPILFGAQRDTWRITTGAAPSVTYNTTWYGDASQCSFFPTNLSSDVPTGRGTSAAVNCATLFPGDQLEITVTNGPNSESSNLYALLSEIGGRFENNFEDIEIKVGETLTLTVADTFTGSVFIRLIQEIVYENRTFLDGVNRIGFIPIHMKMFPATQDYGMKVLGPNGTLAVIDSDTNVASLETTYTSTVNINAGDSVTITKDDAGDGGFVDPIIPGGVGDVESLSSTSTVEITSASANGLVLRNFSEDTDITNLSVSFIRIF